MIGIDRDPLRERQQIHAIATNVRRRLARVSERSRHAAPKVAAEIENGAAVVSDIDYEIDSVMSALPPHAMLDQTTLGRILGCQRRALEMVELLEAMLAAAPFGSAPAYEPARPRALPSPAMFAVDPTPSLGQVLATATRVDRAALQYLPAAAPALGWPGEASRAWHGHPAGEPALAARRPHPAQSADIPPVLARIADNLASRQPARPAHAAPSQPASRGPIRNLAAKPASATLATIAAAFAASVVVWSFVFSSSGEGPQARASMAAAESEDGKKLSGRLGDSSPIETGSVAPSYTTSNGGAAGITVTPPDGPASRPMQVVLSTRSTAEEVKQDFLTFRETYPQILGGMRAKVERLGENDGMIRHRLVLVPAMPAAEAKAVCGALSQMGFSGCWVRPVKVASAQQ